MGGAVACVAAAARDPVVAHQPLERIELGRVDDFTLTLFRAPHNAPHDAHIGRRAADRVQPGFQLEQGPVIVIRVHSAIFEKLLLTHVEFLAFVTQVTQLGNKCKPSSTWCLEKPPSWSSSQVTTHRRHEIGEAANTQRSRSSSVKPAAARSSSMRGQSRRG
jgi:hypothetical protein